MANNAQPRVFELTVNVKEFPDYVINCPCSFTREYMMEKIRRERHHLIKKIMDHIETSSRTNGYPIEWVDTDEPVVTISNATVIIR